MEPPSAQISEPSPTPSPTFVLFARGIIARLAIWPALRLAVDQNWGGPHGAEKRRWLASIIVDAFEQEPQDLDVWYVEEMLAQVMADEFEVELEDGSVEGVAKDMVRLWEEVRGGKGEMVLRFESLAEGLKGKKVPVEEQIGSGSEGDSDEDEDDWEDEDEEPPQLLDRSRENNNDHLSSGPEIDEDGFTLVKGKGRR
jgi:pre-rRNA-processing protein TSR2